MDLCEGAKIINIIHHKNNEVNEPFFLCDKRTFESNSQMNKIKTFKTDFLWNYYPTINVFFLEGTLEEKNIVNTAINIWNTFTSIKMIIIDEINMSNVRISFQKGKGNFSYLGTYCLLLEEKETMNIENPKLYIVLHQLGHVLGLSHEHQHPESGLKWNIHNIIKDLENVWDYEKIKRNIIETNSIENYFGKRYDPYSIMHFSIPEKWMNGKSIPKNEMLSKDDIEVIRTLYPFKSKI